MEYNALDFMSADEKEIALGLINGGEIREFAKYCALDNVISHGVVYCHLEKKHIVSDALDRDSGVVYPTIKRAAMYHPEADDGDRFSSLTSQAIMNSWVTRHSPYKDELMVYLRLLGDFLLLPFKN